MVEFVAWAAVVVTILILIAYEIALLRIQRKMPEQMARSAHANLRQDWFAAISDRSGTEILAVQTLRNSLMSATMTATTAVLGLMGAVNLAAPSLHSSLGESMSGSFRVGPRLVLELGLLTLLFASLVSSTMAVRYYNHLSFIVGTPVESDARKRWAPAGVQYARRAGLLYSWGLRQLLLVAPIVGAIIYPLVGPFLAIIVVIALSVFDRAGPIA